MKKLLILVVALWAFSIENAFAQKTKWFNDKYHGVIEYLYNLDDYDGAKAELIRLSNQGDPQAKCCLAAMLCFGEKNDRDYEKALQLLKESASENFERSEYLLGSFGSLEKSRGFMRIITGDDSMSDVADDSFWKQCFKATKGEVESFKDAFKWFLLEDGSWGYQDIMYFSGVQYLNGSYGITDVDKAIKWLNRSKELGCADASRLLERIMEIINNRDGEQQ